MTSDTGVGLTSLDPEERRRATSELLETDPQGIAELVALALADDDWRVRKEAVQVAQALAPSPAMLKRLVEAFFPSENVGLRNAAVEALAAYGEAAVQMLASRLRDFDADGRKLAVDSLARGCQPSALPILEPLLSDVDANVRVAAAEAIAAIGASGVSEATPLLDRCLVSGDPLIALPALEGLNALSVTLSWETVEQLVRMPALRRAALIAAGRSGDLRAVGLLLEALSAARGGAVGDIVCALRELAREPSALALLRERAALLAEDAKSRVLRLAWDDDAREPVRRAAIVVVAALGLAGAAECAVAALSDDRFLADAHDALELLGPLAATALVTTIRAGDPLATASCLSQVARFQSAPPGVLEAARRALRDPSSEVQTEALAVMSAFGDSACLPDVAECLSLLRAPAATIAAEGALKKLALRHPDAARAVVAGASADGPRAHAACIVLSALVTQGEAANDKNVALLSAALSNPAGSVRRAAIEALAELSHTGAVSAIAFALADEELEVRRVAVSALGKIRSEDGSTPGVSHLVDLVQRSQDAELVAAAARALGEAADPHTLPVLRPLVRSEHPLVAVSAVEALAQFAGPRRLDALLDGLSHSDGEVVKATMLALSDTPDPRVVAHLGTCLDHEAWDVRRLAADLLGRVSGEPAIALLRARLSGEDSPPVQAAIARALERAAGIRRSAPPGSLRPR